MGGAGPPDSHDTQKASGTEPPGGPGPGRRAPPDQAGKGTRAGARVSFPALLHPGGLLNLSMAYTQTVGKW